MGKLLSRNSGGNYSWTGSPLYFLVPRGLLSMGKDTTVTSNGLEGQMWLGFCLRLA